MSTQGATPPDYGTDLGKLRLIIGDAVAVPLDPPQAGQGAYTYFSDDDLTAFLNVEDGVFRAAGLAYASLAAQAANEAQLTKDFDLTLDMRQKAERLQAQSLWFYARADELDAEGAEGFQIVSTGRRRTRAELAETPLIDLDLTEFIV